MKKYNVILLAGGEKGPLYETTGFIEKGLIPIHGKPMVSRVIEAFHASKRVDQIVVVGSAKIGKLDAMAHVRKRVIAGFNVVQSLLHAIAYVKHRLHRGDANHRGYIISFGDAVFLTPQIIDATLKTIEEIDGDVVLHYVEKSTLEAAGLPTTRTFIPVEGKLYTGTTIYYIRRFGKVIKAMPKMIQLRKHRKDPQALLRQLNCDGQDLSEIKKALSKKLAVDCHICISDHARLALDVDKPSDLELATQLLKECNP